MSDLVVFSASMVTVLVSSTLNTYNSEKRFNRGLTLAELKCKLELVVGTPASCMELELYSPDNKLLMRMDSDDALLGSYPVDDGCRIHVIDKSGSQIGEYDDVSRVDKFEISFDAYDKRSDSVRSFLKRNKMGQFKEDDLEKSDLEEKLAVEKSLGEAITVGARCECSVAGHSAKRGTVMYSGLTDFKPGYWIGVRYDEPVGKHDGSVKGKQYFQCQPKYGAFVKPQFVRIGDFPEEDYGLDEM